MSVQGKCCVVVLTAAAVAAPLTVNAVVGPDSTFSGAQVYPLPRRPICPGGGCYGYPPIYGATQSSDCDKAGLANPVPYFPNYDSSLYTVPRHTRLYNPQDYYNPQNWAVPGAAAGMKYPISGALPQFYVPTDPARDGLQYFGKPKEFMFFPRMNFGINAWPSANSTYQDAGADLGPIKGSVGGGESYEWTPEQRESWLKQIGTSLSGNWTSSLPDTPRYKLRAQGVTGINVETPIGAFPDNLAPYLNQQYNLGGTTWSGLMFGDAELSTVNNLLSQDGIRNYQLNPCRRVLVPTDPNFVKTGRNEGNSWGVHGEDDQWAIKRVGFTDDKNSAWSSVPESAADVVVAVIDTGLDWHHRDISYGNIWRNPGEDPDNGIDDDSNGYVDDVIGWDFLAKNNKPWDFDGHGTVVTGIIAAEQNNGAGIAGINPHARIMVLKAVNNFGTTRASFIAEAIVYAVDNGAQVVNISVGGPHTSRMEQAAIDYARRAGVLVVVASGNEGVELGDFGPGGADGVLTVGATHVNDRAAAFSNYGEAVDLVAPGVDVLSLRARFTDANYRPDVDPDGEYVLGTNIVGEDRRYLHVSGTSFSAPIVAGVASLLFSKHPELSAADVERVLIETATDLEFPGRDEYTGWGMVNAQAALSVDPGFTMTAEISDLKREQTEEGADFVRVEGTIGAARLKRAWVQIGPGENPGVWKYVGQKRKYPITNGTISTIPVGEFAGADLWQVVVSVEDRNGVIRRAARPIRID